MKKVLCFAIAFFLSFGCLTGCGETSNTGNNGGEATAATTTTTAATTTTTQAETTTTTTTTKATTTTTAQQNVEFDQLFDEESSDLYFVGQNSVGGLQYTGFFKYIGEKEVKYCNFYFEMENSVKDPAYDDITGNNRYVWQGVGPLTKNNYITIVSKSDVAAYSKVCYYLWITKIEVEYMDGTKDTVIPLIRSTNIMLENLISCNDAWTDAGSSIMGLYPDYVNYVKRNKS